MRRFLAYHHATNRMRPRAAHASEDVLTQIHTFRSAKKCTNEPAKGWMISVFRESPYVLNLRLVLLWLGQCWRSWAQSWHLLRRPCRWSGPGQPTPDLTPRNSRVTTDLSLSSLPSCCDILYQCERLSDEYFDWVRLQVCSHDGIIKERGSGDRALTYSQFSQ